MATKKPERGERTSKHSQKQAASKMGAMMHKKVAKTNQMREQIPRKQKST